MITCAAIDDEFLALEIISNYIERIPDMRLAEVFTSPLEASAALAGLNIDLLLLDIDMPEITGLDFLNTLKNPPLTIFTTAYSQFALAGYEHNAVDYLVKPIPFSRFLSAVQKARDRLAIKRFSTSQATDLFIKSDHKTVRVPLADVLFIEGKKDFVCIHTMGNAVNTLMTITGLMERLASANFVRVHRSFIISLDKIDCIERGHIIIGKAKIPIGDQYRNELNQRISQF